MNPTFKYDAATSYGRAPPDAVNNMNTSYVSDMRHEKTSKTSPMEAAMSHNEALVECMSAELNALNAELMRVLMPGLPQAAAEGEQLAPGESPWHDRLLSHGASLQRAIEYIRDINNRLTC